VVGPLVGQVSVLSEAFRDDLAVVGDPAARPREIEDDSATGRVTLYVVLTCATQVPRTVG